MDIFLHICFTWSDHIRLLSAKTPKILSLDIVFKDSSIYLRLRLVFGNL